MPNAPAPTDLNGSRIRPAGSLRTAVLAPGMATVSTVLTDPWTARSTYRTTALLPPGRPATSRQSSFSRDVR